MQWAVAASVVGMHRPNRSPPHCLAVVAAELGPQLMLVAPAVVDKPAVAVGPAVVVVVVVEPAVAVGPAVVVVEPAVAVGPAAVVVEPAVAVEPGLVWQLLEPLRPLEPFEPLNLFWQHCESLRLRR